MLYIYGYSKNPEEQRHMMKGEKVIPEMTIEGILDDLRMAEDVLRKFERRYLITSEQLYELYNQGLLDHGEQPLHQ